MSNSRKRPKGRKKKVVPALPSRPELIRVRNSRVHGRGVFALRRIRRGTRIIEYLGERLSHKQADRRHDGKDETDNHTFLFIVDRGVVIDGGAGGNDARYINHGCDPNCESVIDDRRVFIEAVRTIRPGEELNYDYQIGRDSNDPANVDEIFACRCGAERCRGSMLWPPKRSSGARQSGRTRSAAKRANAKDTLARRAAAKRASAKRSAASRSAATRNDMRLRSAGNR